MTRLTTMLALAAMVVLAAPTLAPAQGAGTGPVGTQCKSDIDKFCKGLRHGGTAVRSCLERNRADVSAACRAALDNTGGGRGRNRGL